MNFNFINYHNTDLFQFSPMLRSCRFVKKRNSEFPNHPNLTRKVLQTPRSPASKIYNCCTLTQGREQSKRDTQNRRKQRRNFPRSGRTGRRSCKQNLSNSRVNPEARELEMEPRLVIPAQRGGGDGSAGKKFEKTRRRGATNADTPLTLAFRAKPKFRGPGRTVGVV